LHFEKLKGRREDQHSVRLNNQYRLILTLDGQHLAKVVRIIRIEDYH
jgi:proteic killer suppression protein